MTALPLPVLSAIPLDSRGLSIWPALTEAERLAQSQATKYNDTLIATRLLGFLLLDLWEHQDVNPFGLVPYSHILTEIESCADNGVDAIYALGLTYRNSFMRLCAYPFLRLSGSFHVLTWRHVQSAKTMISRHHIPRLPLPRLRPSQSTQSTS